MHRGLEPGTSTVFHDYGALNRSWVGCAETSTRSIYPAVRDLNLSTAYRVDAEIAFQSAIDDLDV